MHASEAKKKADARQSALKTARDKRISFLLQEIYKIIDEAAGRGAYKETYTFNTLADNSDVRDGVIKILREVGYTVSIGGSTRDQAISGRGWNTSELSITIHWN